MKDAIFITGCIALLIGGASWVLSAGRTKSRTTYCAVIRHTKPRGLEIAYSSRLKGACDRYIKAHRLLGVQMVVMARSDVDAANVESISSQAFWADIANLTQGTPSAVAGHARDLEVLAARLGAVARKLYRVIDTEQLTMIDGIPIGPERVENEPMGRPRRNDREDGRATRRRK